MVAIRIEQMIPAPVTEVWDDIARIDRHVEWMADAERITFLTDETSGAGTRIEVLTKVGPLSTTDVMEFTEWEPPHRMAIVHRGLVTGVGAFTLEPVGDRATRFVWEEELAFPVRFGGRVTAIAAAPVLRTVWRRNLRRLAARF
jgi:uncharacterized protein YndB with AHSA1/START domain